MMKYELTAIGVGPGDPELLTVKAAEAIKGAEVILCPASAEDRPSIALSIAERYVSGQIIKLVFPMTKDKDVLEVAWRRNARIMAETALTGKKTVYLTVGDPYLYSTWIYMHRDLRESHPEIDITVIPGVVSIFTFASKVGVSIAEGSEKVAIIPSCYDLSSVAEIARHAETMVFLKDGRYFDSVIDLLRSSGFPDDSIFAIGQDLGTDREVVRRMTLGEVDGSLATKYFSILVVKRV